MNQVQNVAMELCLALDAFAAMQQRHASFLAEGRLQTLPEWAAEHEHSFLRVKQCLDRFDPDMVDGKSEIAVRIRQGLEKIMRAEQGLIAATGRKRDKLKENLQKLRRGKTVLKGYSLQHGAGPRPKYLSNRA